MAAPALVACCNTARLRSPYILVFRPLRVEPISASSVAASFSEPPSLISVSAPQPRLYLLCHFPFFVESGFFFPPPREQRRFIFTVSSAKKKGRLISARSSVQGCFAHTTTKWDHDISKTHPNDTVFVWKAGCTYYTYYTALTTKDHQVCS